jgi:very-short-patch-repair endonuclease
VLDFYAHQIKLVIELDGGQHYDEQNVTYDKNRGYALKRVGIEVLRYSNRDIDFNFNNVMDDIYTQVRARV